MLCLGTGYNLSIVRDRASYKHEEVESVIKEYVPHAYLKSENGDTLYYLLPDESKNNFCQLLERLENNKDTLGFSSISVSVTTLEDVFLKVGTPSDTKENHENSRKLEARISVTDCEYTKQTLYFYIIVMCGINLLLFFLFLCLLDAAPILISGIFFCNILNSKFHQCTKCFRSICI